MAMAVMEQEVEVGVSALMDEIEVDELIASVPNSKSKNLL